MIVSKSSKAQKLVEDLYQMITKHMENQPHINHQVHRILPKFPNPKMTVNQMVQLADEIGIDLILTSKQIPIEKVRIKKQPQNVCPVCNGKPVDRYRPYCGYLHAVKGKIIKHCLK